MSQQINIGDVVKLNSGGPKMTVSYVTCSEDKDENGNICPLNSFICQWFINEELKSGCFTSDSLEKKI
ncbi:MAG: YodC family protein [Bacteroidetes bacterium]|nr:YodC family protein [Bacteroidota bacterium]